MFNINDKFNIITFPKCGSTQIIKILLYEKGLFEKHNHSWYHNSEHNLIRTCASNELNKNINYNNITYVFIREHKYRILSYYLSNYNENLSFYNFIKKLINNKINHNNHLDPFIIPNNIKIIELVDMKNINIFFNEKFNTDKFNNENFNIENNSNNFFNNKNLEYKKDIYNVERNNLKYFNFKKEDFFSAEIINDINFFYEYNINDLKKYKYYNSM